MTSWSTVLEKLIVTQLVKFPFCNETWKFITMFQEPATGP
jgi:hypothetical protein